MILGYLRTSIVVLALTGMLLGWSGCKDGKIGEEKAEPDTRELLVFVTQEAYQVREKAEFYGLKVKTIDTESAASQVIQTLLNSPSDNYFVVINPVIKRYIAGGAISDKVNPSELDELFRQLKQVSKAGIQQLDRLQPQKEGSARLAVFSDFQCPYCKLIEDFIPQLKTRYGDKLEIEFIHFPLASHELAFEASEASECAREQNRFEEYKQEIFDQQESLSKNSFRQIARELNLDMKSFSSCLELHQQRKKVRQEQYFGQYLGINGTPTLFIDGEMVSSPSPEEIQNSIEDKLNQKSADTTAQKEDSKHRQSDKE